MTAGSNGDLLFTASGNAIVTTSSKPGLGIHGVTRIEPDASGAHLVVHTLESFLMPAASDQPTFD